MKSKGKIILTRILFLFLGAFFLFAGIAAIVNGKFREGGRYGLRGPEISRVDEPLQFWLCVSAALIVGTVAFWTAFRKK